VGRERTLSRRATEAPSFYLYKRYETVARYPAGRCECTMNESVELQMY